MYWDSNGNLCNGQDMLISIRWKFVLQRHIFELPSRQRTFHLDDKFQQSPMLIYNV